MADQDLKQISDNMQQSALSPADTAADLGVPIGVTDNIGEVNREFQEKSILRKAKESGMPYINIAKTPINPDFLKLVDYDKALEAHLMPFFRVGKKLKVAVVDPENPKTKEILDDLKAKDFEVDLSLASQAGVEEAMQFYKGSQKDYKKIELVENVEEESIDTYEKEIESLADIPEQLSKVTAEQGLNLMNIGAMKTNASDIHYEPEEGKIVVRFRIDGVLHKIFEIKPEIYKNLSNQLKYQSKMQLNVVTIPQDGRYVFNFNGKKIAVRVSSIPTPYGESYVCRYLVGDDKPVDFVELGFQGLALKKIQNVCKISHGMVLATGPTGSGKSTTLYALLRKMTSPQNKVITLEDPVEYNIEGVTQSQIDEKHGYNFANGLRAVLRQDPDVVMLGEIRDLETAQTAAQAALTGHIVLSTLHTNSAIESIPRLINMGLAPFMVAPALDTIIAQRLVRKVCSACSTLESIPESAKKEFEETMKNLAKVNPSVAVEVPEKIPTVHGCQACSSTGYSGRVVLAEVITINNELKALILNNASLVDLITAVRKEGITTMREDGFLKVAQGITTLEEVFRVTNVSE